jgi:cholesterol transport system auxiliary component
MVYLRRPHEVSYYAANQWVDTPGRMLSPLLARAMRTIGLWRAVVQAPSSVRTDYLLDCDNLVLEQQFFSQPSRVRLALRAQIVETKNRAILGTRYFEIFEAAPSDDAYGGVVAANRATARLLNEMAEWLKTNARNTK